MKRLSLAFAGLLLVMTAFAQNTIKDPNAEVRQVKAFHGIRVSAGIELLLVQGNEEAVAVSAKTTALRDNIKTVVEDGILRIYFDNKIWKNDGNRRLKAYVSAVKLDELDVSAGASIKVDGQIKSPKLELEVSSGGSFKGAVETGELSVDQSSGSIVNISGKTDLLKVEGSSGSQFNGYELEAENGEAEISSGGQIKLTVNKELSAEASSGGAISYKGKGVIRNIRTGSGGGVTRRN